MAGRYRPGRSAARKLDGTRTAHSEIPVRIAGENRSGSSGIEKSRTNRYRCPNCGSNALDFARKPHRDGTGLTTVVHCFGCGAGLDTVSAATGIPRYRLLGWPPPDALGPPVERSRWYQAGDPPPLPTLGQISGWHSRLLNTPHALDYLLGRGISLEIVKRFCIGWEGDRQRLTFPMRGGLLKTRELGNGQMRCWPGRDRPWPLYPRVERKADWVALVAGELDALCGLSAGLPAVSVTLGVGYWRPVWADELRGLYVLVVFDNNEGALADRRVRELRDAGLGASRLNLRSLGVAEPKGDLSDYLNAGGDPTRIKPPGRRVG